MDLKLEDIGSFALLGLLLNNIEGRNPSEVDDTIKIVCRNVNPGVDLFAEVNNVQKIFPKAKISLFRDGTRELWK